MNKPVASILQRVTGQDFGGDKESWKAWWTDQQGYAYVRPTPSQKRTIVRQVVYQQPVHHSCFGAGTPVRTLTRR